MSTRTSLQGTDDALQTQIVDGVLGLTKPAGIALSDQQARLLAQHAVMMLRWNERSNLTRITSINEVLSRHLLDSLIPARWLPNQGHALDVGTGAGFPGVPLKVLYPALTMVLLEAQRKKVSFLKVLLANLRLEGIRCRQGRWQDLVCSDAAEWAQQFDLITLRALRLQPAELANLAGRLVKFGGMVAWWIGSSETETSLQSYNSAMTGAGLAIEGCFRYDLPLGGGARRISIWKRVA